MRHRSWRPALARASIAGATMGVTIIALSVPAMAAPPTTPNGCSNPTPASSNPNCPSGATGTGAGGTGVAGNNNGNNGGGGNNTNNPPGNNGTVKIHDVGANAATDPDPRNQPHVGCTFVTDYFGFDANQPLSAAFVAQPPSGHGEDLNAPNGNVITLVGSSVNPVTTDADGNGNSGSFQDATQTWSFDADKAQTLGLTYQPQQGYHVQLTVTTGQPGPNGVKHKVFWVNCNQSSTPGGTTSTPSGVQVCKATISGLPVGAAAPSFRFNVTGATPNSVRVTAGGPCVPLTPNAKATTVTVTEVPANGYTLQAISVNPSTAGSGDVKTGTATVDVTNPSGSVPTVTVTFTNAVATVGSVTPPGGGGTPPGGGNTPGGTTTPPVVTPPVVTPPVVHPQTPPPSGTQVSPVKVVTSTPSTQVLGEKFTRSATPQVAATQATTLPFTGASHTGALLTSGLGALLGGGLLMVAGRKRRTA